MEEPEPTIDGELEASEVVFAYGGLGVEEYTPAAVEEDVAAAVDVDTAAVELQYLLNPDWAARLDRDNGVNVVARVIG